MPNWQQLVLHHQISQVDEILHIYDGDPLKIYMSKDKKEISTVLLGKNINNKEYLHYIVKSETWFGMKSTGSWSLIGCSVSPAFDYKDFELASKDWKI